MNPEVLSRRRLILWCPYVHWHLAPTLASKVMGQMGSCKYQWLQRLIVQFRDNVFVYCDAKHTSMVHYRENTLAHVTNPEQRKEIILAEALRWNELNNFQIPRDHFISRPESIESGDIIFTFTSHFFDGPPSPDTKYSDIYKVFSRSDVFKVAHLTHYMFWLGNIASHLRQFNFDLLCYESDLSKFKFFRQHVPFVRNVAIVPFAIQDRFQAKKSYAERTNRCVVTGGVARLPYNPGLIEFYFEFGCDNLFPLRLLLAENAAGLADFMYIKTGQYYTSMGEALKSSVGTSLSWEELVHKPIEEILQIDTGKKIPYYSEDIVSLYNAFRFSYISEELCHAPALGFFEAMACGTVPLAVESDMYRDIGVLKNTHYIPFDGSFGGLMRTLIAAYKNPQAYAHIPENNKTLVKSFSEQRIADLFVEKLTQGFRAWNSARTSTPRSGSATNQPALASASVK